MLENTAAGNDARITAARIRATRTVPDGRGSCPQTERNAPAVQRLASHVRRNPPSAFRHLCAVSSPWQAPRSSIQRGRNVRRLSRFVKTLSLKVVPHFRANRHRVSSMPWCRYAPQVSRYAFLARKCAYGTRLASEPGDHDGRRVRHAAHLRAAAADQDRLLPAGNCHRCRRVHAGRARALRAVRRRRLCAVLPEHRGLLGGQAPPRRGEVMTRTTLAALALLATMSPAAAHDWDLAYPKQGETQRDLPKGVTLHPNPVKTIKIDTRLDPKPVKIIRIFRPPAR